jgi:hypothetical protein
MFFLLCLVAILAVSLLAGGQLSRLGQLRVRLVWLPVVALAIQVVITTVVEHRAPEWLDASLHVASYAMLVAFLVVNRTVPGLVLLGAGVLSNGITIALNRGTLPASARALREAGIATHGGFANSAVLTHPHLRWLGDIVATPPFLPFRNVMSVGDALIMIGAAWLVWATCGTRRRRATALSGDGLTA